MPIRNPAHKQRSQERVERFAERAEALSALHKSPLVGALTSILLSQRALFVATRISFMSGRSQDPEMGDKLSSSMAIERQLEEVTLQNIVPILIEEGVDVDALEADICRLLQEQQTLHLAEFKGQA
jgi:hypothetical protein